MRRQTATCGVAPAGSGRNLRLDPLSLPVRFDAHDPRADGYTRQIELHRERVVLRRAVRGMQMAINVRVSDFIGIALRGHDDARSVVLVHRDPSLSVPLLVSADAEELAEAWSIWSELFALPQLDEGVRKPAPRRRRCNAIRARRPKFLMRRRVAMSRELPVHHGEREIIARD